MIKAIWVNGKQDGFEKVCSVREQVFVFEQGCDILNERDEFDEISAHVLLCDENNLPVATGRLFPNKTAWTIGRVAVLKEHRKKNYGDLVMRMLCTRAFEAAPCAKIVIHSQSHAIAFYEKFGFEKIGLPFFEENIEHYEMSVTEKTYDAHKQCSK